MSVEPGTLQRRLGEALFARVAGPDGPANRARFATPGPRWFAPDRPIRRVHGDAAMFVGGLRALLLQSLHPQAMIAVAQHSDYRADPWGRLQRTSTFLAATTFGAADDAQRAVDHVRHVHQFITGTGPDGRPYRADDPHLLRWVHVAETDSFLRCHQRYGARPLDADRLRRLRRRHRQDRARPRRARPAADTRRAGRGARRLPARAAGHARGPRGGPVPGLEPAAAAACPRPVRPADGGRDRGTAALGAAGAAPPRLPVAEPVLVPPAGRAIVGAIRWAMAARR